nr:hypothetical protein CFP56_44340 [Quercus suber]
MTARDRIAARPSVMHTIDSVTARHRFALLYITVLFLGHRTIGFNVTKSPLVRFVLCPLRMWSGSQGTTSYDQSISPRGRHNIRLYICSIDGSCRQERSARLSRSVSPPMARRY